jgi:long-chain acyl-CoA synthetase
MLLQGTPIVLRDGFVPHQFSADAETYGIRVFPGVPFMFDHFTSHMAAGAWPATVARLISAGARLEPANAGAFHQRFGLKIHSFYGTSETGGIAYDDSREIQDSASVGRALPGVTITLRREEGGPEDAGRVHVAGSAVASGYVGFSPTTEGFTGDGFLTGDFGRFNARNHLVLTGRVSSFINVAGRKVQPEEVEQVLRAMPGIVAVQIIGAPDPVRGQQIVACYVVSGEDPGVLAIRRFCASRLAPFKIPRTCIPLAEIPVTERGKIDRRRLQTLVLEHLGTAENRVL